MELYDIPLLLALAGLTLYMVLGGADFGAGFWQLAAGRSPLAARVRDHAHHAMAPVWEANHVWLIFVLVILWTAYPVAFGSIASTLSIPLFIAAVGIICRGAAYALRAGAQSRELRLIDTVFSVSSILTLFAFGAAVGGIASGRVPVGNAEGDLVTSWLNATSIMVGSLAAAAGTYLAAVYLAADAARVGDDELVEWFRRRALAAGVVAGAIALGGIFVLRSDAESLYDGLVEGNGLPALILSVAAGVAALALVAVRRFELSRYTAAVATAAVVAGWALAQQPVLLPGLTVEQAAAPHDTLVALLVALAAGAAILLPSLTLLFRLTLKGAFDPGAAHPPPVQRESRSVLAASAPGMLTRSAIGCLIAGFGLLTIAETSWAHALGVAFLCGFIAVGFVAVVLSELGTPEPG